MSRREKGDGVIRPLLLSFFTGFENERGDESKEHGGGDAACRGAQTAGQRAQQSFFRHGLLHALGQRMAKAGQRRGGSGTAPVYQILIEADSVETFDEISAHDGSYGLLKEDEFINAFMLH